MAVNQISEQGRATQGVKLIRVDDGDEIAAITQLDEKDEELEETEPGLITGDTETSNGETDEAGENATDEIT